MGSKTFKYSLSLIYGPARSRRLGLSLGVNPSPLTCSFNCVYCECGEKAYYVESPERVPIKIAHEVVYRSLGQVLNEGGESRLDTITFSGTGEPTLNDELGLMIKDAKALADTRVTVITNSSLLHRRSVREALGSADEVVAKLNASSQKTFLSINRPVDKSLSIGDIIEGLTKFKQESCSSLTIEILLVDLEGSKGNSSLEEIKGLSEALRKIEPDKVHIHTIARYPLESYVHPVSRGKILEAASAFEKVLGRGRIHTYSSGALKYSIFRSTLLGYLRTGDPEAYRRLIEGSYKCPFTGRSLNPMNFCYCASCGLVFSMKEARIRLIDDEYVLLCPKCSADLHRSSGG